MQRDTMLALLRERRRTVTEASDDSSLFDRTVSLHGVAIDNIDGIIALGAIRRFVKRTGGHGARKVFFVNVHSLHLALKDGRFRHCLNRGDLVLADGSGLLLAGKILKTPFAENLNGTDFTPRLLREAEIGRWPVYLLGARQEVLDRCRVEIARLFPGLQIVGCHHGYFSKAEESEIITEVNATGPALLLVALGSPLQELWIGKYAPLLNAGVCLGVGGLFDFLSGERRRAPLWMRSLGIEWLFRFMVEPTMKWRRVLIEIPLFLARLVPHAWRVHVSRNGERTSPWATEKGFHA